ncbi:putative DNA-directed RNA polymerase [Lupinus albus]|uniref:Putative DNA-directed RNA polymerase n=1 Tax=Lupinus albus TaxID=3870 RepID=A0A6A4QFN8_LUPAL|nr:putative DNA-directed RNA polymerase [Lupinus albus]
MDHYQEKVFCFGSPIIRYEIADGTNLVTPFPQDLFQERVNLELKVLNYILYGNGKSIREISDTSIQLVRTCLVLNWDQNKKSSSIEKAFASLVEISTNGLICDFIRIDLGKSHTWKSEKGLIRTVPD